MSAHKSLAFVLVLAMFAAKHGRADVIDGYAAMGASWTEGFYYETSWIPYLSYVRGYDFGGFFQPHNVATNGASSASLLSDGQHVAVRNFVQSGDVDLAFLAIGGNDFNEAIEDISSGALAGSALESWANTTVDNILTAVDTVMSANPTGMVVWGMPDMTLVPGVRDFLSTQEMTDRGIFAINLVNSILEPQVVSRGLVYADVAKIMRDLDTSPLVVGGVTIDMDNEGSDPEKFYQDFLHPGAVANGIFANLMIEATNLGYGTQVALLTDAEMIHYSDMPQPYIGETSNINYSQYIHVEPGVRVVPEANTLILTGMAALVMVLRGKRIFAGGRR